MNEGDVRELVVVDLTQGVAGPYCTKLLADYGAEVWKVEPPGGDRARGYGPFPNDEPHREKGGLFLYLNTNKKCVTLDLAAAEGREALLRLLSRADALVEDGAPGEMASLGLGYDDLRARFPRLVYASITPFGQTGPYRDYRGNSLTSLAMSSILFSNGDPDREPLTTGGPAGEMLAGEHAWFGILAALAYRDRFGPGQHVDVSMAEAALCCDEANAALYSYAGIVRRRFFSRLYWGYPNELMRCKDGWVVVTGGTAGFPNPQSIASESLTGMSLLIGDPDLETHPLHVAGRERWLRWQEWEALVQPWLLEHEADEIVSTAQALRMPFGHVSTMRDLFESEHLRERRFFATIDHPATGPLPYPGPPFRMSEMEFLTRRAPLLGEHNGDVPVETPSPDGALVEWPRGGGLPLEGIRVLDFTQVYAGPACCRMLLELGAEVIKVEGPHRTDVARALVLSDNEPGDEPWERSAYFSVRNAGKKGICVDLARPEGRDLMRRLIAHCDVVAEAFTPRVMRNFGLDYESLKEVKRDIIMISMSGYGQTGPQSSWSAYGTALEPASGMSQMMGYVDGPPHHSGLAITDPMTGFFAAGAVLLALRHRARTGRGQHIDMSEHEAAIGFAAWAAMDYAMNGREFERIGNRSLWCAPQGVYRCRGEDEWLALSAETDEQWEALCRVLGWKEWLTDGRFATADSRLANHDALDEGISMWTRGRDKRDAMRELQQAGVTAAAVLTGKEVLFDDQFRARRMYRSVKHPVLGWRLVNRQSAALFERFEGDFGAAPTLGQHNREVLRGLLGMSDGEIDSLEAEGVIATRPVLATTVENWGKALQVPIERMLEMGGLVAIEPDYREQLGLAEEVGHGVGA